MRSRFALLFGALLAFAVIGAAPVAADDAAGGTYLALGDSVPAGTQQPAPFTDNAYTNVLFEKLERNYGFDNFVNLACPADDSNEMLDGDNGPNGGSICYGEDALFDFGAPSQLEAAEAVLAQGDVRLITLTIGANDLFLCSDSVDPNCIPQVLGQWANNLGRPDGIIARLRAAAPGVPIVAMNYYTPDLAFWITTPAEFQDDFLAGQIEFSAGGNAFIGATYAQLGVPVVDVAGAFDTAATNGSTPKNVRQVCKFTLMCEKDRGDYVLSDYDPGTPGPQTDIHPSNAGHKQIAKAFKKLIKQQDILD